jgi:hypothetical protein
MTAEQVVGYLLEGEGLDVLRESLCWVVQQFMEAEVSELVGAVRGKRAPEVRLTHRNGYRAQPWATRAGEIELAIPRLRRGSYFPSFLEPRKRSEQALVAVVQEAYVAGVSTRKVDQVVESLGLRISKSEVSRICQGLDEQVDAFRNRPLEDRYPYLWLDLFWHALRTTCEDGYRWFDFGRSDLPDRGLRDFKSGWAAQEQPLLYTTLAERAPASGSGRGLAAARVLLRHSPGWACRAAGELFYRYAA